MLMFAVEQPFQQKDKIISRNPRLKSSLYCFIEDFFNEDLDLNNLPIEFIEILKKVIVLKKKIIR